MKFSQYGRGKELLETYKNSVKIMFVRDPVERLVSAYMDKLVHNKPYPHAAFPYFSSEVARTYGTRWRDETVGSNTSLFCSRPAISMSKQSNAIKYFHFIPSRRAFL